MGSKNPFNRKYVEKMLLAQFMPNSTNRRLTRKYMRKFARHIEHAFEIGVKDGESGNRLITADELTQADESETARTIVRYAYTAYCRGYHIGKEVTT